MTEKIVYSDLSFLLDIDAAGNVVKVTNNDAIIQSLKTIISTSPGERIMNPEFGSGIRLMLFDPMDDINATVIEHEIADAISTWENRIILRGVKVEPNYDKNIYVISIAYTIKPTQENSGMTIGLRSQA